MREPLTKSQATAKLRGLLDSARALGEQCEHAKFMALVDAEDFYGLKKLSVARYRPGAPTPRIVSAGGLWITTEGHAALEFARALDSACELDVKSAELNRLLRTNPLAGASPLHAAISMRKQALFNRLGEELRATRRARFGLWWPLSLNAINGPAHSDGRPTRYTEGVAESGLNREYVWPSLLTLAMLAGGEYYLQLLSMGAPEEEHLDRASRCLRDDGPAFARILQGISEDHGWPVMTLADIESFVGRRWDLLEAMDEATDELLEGKDARAAFESGLDAKAFGDRTVRAAAETGDVRLLRKALDAGAAPDANIRGNYAWVHVRGAAPEMHVAWMEGGGDPLKPDEGKNDFQASAMDSAIWEHEDRTVEAFLRGGAKPLAIKARFLEGLLELAHRRLGSAPSDRMPGARRIVELLEGHDAWTLGQKERKTLSTSIGSKGASTSGGSKWDAPGGPI